MVESTTSAPPAPPTPAVTLEEMLAALTADRGDWLAEQVKKAYDKSIKDREKDAAKAQSDALAAKRGEFIAAVRDTIKDAIPALGITIPDKGFKFTLTVKRSDSGMAPDVTLEDAQKKASTSSTSSGNGARAPRGSGSGKSVTQISDVTGFILVNGSEVKTAADLSKALGLFAEHPGDNQGRVVAAWALKPENLAKANAVKIIVSGTPRPLGDVVIEHFGPKPEAAPVAAS